MSFYGRPTSFPFITSMEDIDTVDSPGGYVSVRTAAETLLIGDAVYLNYGNRVGKSIETSLGVSRFLGIVVGGQTFDPGGQATNDQALVIGDTAATVGQFVLVQQTGICYAIADAAITQGESITMGRSTAGRVRGDQVTSYAGTVPGLAIKAGASAVVKAVNVTQTVVSGVAGTATAANLDMAALSGTTANGKFAAYVFRVAADGTTVTSAKSADADSLALLLWPTGSSSLVTLGCVIINPTGTGGFVGGTTALDDATVVPNAVYHDLVRNRYIIGRSLEAASAAAGAVKINLIA